MHIFFPLLVTVGLNFPRMMSFHLRTDCTRKILSSLDQFGFLFDSIFKSLEYWSFFYIKLRVQFGCRD